MATIEVDEHELRMRVRQWAQQSAAEYLTNRITDAHPMAYFAPPDDSFVTYRALASVMEEVRRLSVEIWSVRRQMRPWWKRWFGR